MSAPVKKLLKIMARLRGPGGCPWDRKQTHRSIIPHLRSECEEVIDSIQRRNPHDLCEELGDILLHIVFHSQMAREKGHFDFQDVVRTLNRKLIRRHPHVFGKNKLKDTPAVLKQWEEIKAREKRDRRRARHRRPKAKL